MNSPAVWTQDHYSLRKYSPLDINYFLDIGACVGTTSVFFKSIDPYAKVIAIEPCRDNFISLCAAAIPWNVKCYNLAFGNGERLCYDHRRNMLSHRFYTEREKKWWPKKPEYFVDSMSLSDLFAKFKIKGRYIIKMDSEGGERFLLGNKPDIEIIRNSIQFNMELHKGFGGPLEQWADWFDLFKDTHTLFVNTKGEYGPKKECIYKQVDKPINAHRKEYMLVKK